MEVNAAPPAAVADGWSGAGVAIEERSSWTANGWLFLALGVILTGVGAWFVVSGAILKSSGEEPLPEMIIGVLAFTVAGVIFSCLTIVNPGEARVLQFLGRYIGTTRTTGLSAVAPFTSRATISVKVNNFETSELKVNDAEGNPVNIAAIIVWQVADTAKARFAVERYPEFVAVQSEAALRHVAMRYPYDDSEGQADSLRGSTEQVASELASEVAARVSIAGIQVVEARISALAYAPEIAQAMLQRQQAAAIIAAREKIVEGAVSMVNGALERLEREQIVELDEERKAAMVSNLLVVLASDSRVSPVVNAGSLYT